MENFTTKKEQELMKEKQELINKEQELMKEKQELINKEQELMKGKQELINKEQELMKGKQELINKEQKLMKEKQELINKEQELMNEKEINTVEIEKELKLLEDEFNKSDYNGATLLHYFAQKKPINKDLFNHFIKSGADWNKQDVK
ncbi:neuroblast differentiation-associated protein ahnak-like protein [Anaeramoeba ignava]|uniref:Neuroblast differentiation-associated protein ahnak-like protein n=1 Tax=Anaeramoeba ignava TaxID=1746090 RepID=A0A9Q0LY87_ANAIG|nr:neuroblast differentiation-associated protein ahnak-like protein [Anaeramoeba ignava]